MPLRIETYLRSQGAQNGSDRHINRLQGLRIARSRFDPHHGPASADNHQLAHIRNPIGNPRNIGSDRRLDVPGPQVRVVVGLQRRAIEQDGDGNRGGWEYHG